MTTRTDLGADARYKGVMDNRGNLERQIDGHRMKIAEFVEELCHLETLVGRIARVPWQLIRHMGLLRVALKGRRASEEIVAERLAQECRAMNSLMRG